MSCDMCMIFYRIALHYDELLRRPFIRAPSKHVIIWHMEKHETIAQKMLFLHDNDTVLYLHVALLPCCPRVLEYRFLQHQTTCIAIPYLNTFQVFIFRFRILRWPQDDFYWFLAVFLHIRHRCHRCCTHLSVSQQYE